MKRYKKKKLQKKILFLAGNGRDMKRIVVASDSFKGSLNSLEVAEAAEQGIHKVFPSCEVIKVNVADGGEGTVDALLQTMGGSKVSLVVNDPLGRPVAVGYGILGDGATAVMDMSVASGLPLLSDDERNPSRTSTYGTGQMISDALARGCRKFLIGIGGSATNDAGMGMLSALGFIFKDAAGNVLEGRGADMARVAGIDMSEVDEAVREAEFIVACDVDSPFCGPDGAAYVFAPQKGADSRMVEELDSGMCHFAEFIHETLDQDIKTVPGAGAAGGLGGGFIAFMNARLERGVEMILDTIGFDRMIEGSDLVITGEGRIDFQTLTGKTPYGVMKRARNKGIKVVAVAGSVAQDVMDDIDGFDIVMPVTPVGMPLNEAMNPSVASANVSAAVERIMQIYKKCRMKGNSTRH